MIRGVECHPHLTARNTFLAHACRHGGEGSSETGLSGRARWGRSRGSWCTVHDSELCAPERACAVNRSTIEPFPAHPAQEVGTARDPMRGYSSGARQLRHPATGFLIGSCLGLRHTIASGYDTLRHRIVSRMGLFITCPVEASDATAFYSALGWTLNPRCPIRNVSCFAIAPEQYVMLGKPRMYAGVGGVELISGPTPLEGHRLVRSPQPRGGRVRSLGGRCWQEAGSATPTTTRSCTNASSATPATTTRRFWMKPDPALRPRERPRRYPGIVNPMNRCSSIARLLEGPPQRYSDLQRDLGVPTNATRHPPPRTRN